MPGKGYRRILRILKDNSMSTYYLFSITYDFVFDLQSMCIND